MSFQFSDIQIHDWICCRGFLPFLHSDSPKQQALHIKARDTLLPTHPLCCLDEPPGSKRTQGAGSKDPLCRALYAAGMAFPLLPWGQSHPF